VLSGNWTDNGVARIGIPVASMDDRLAPARPSMPVDS
jgi:hypothetical protein